MKEGRPGVYETERGAEAGAESAGGEAGPLEETTRSGQGVCAETAADFS